MLDNRSEPVKNTIHWGWRTPTPEIEAFTDDRETHSTRYDDPDFSVEFSVQGRSAGVFDDIYLSLTVTQRYFIGLAAVDDLTGQRALAFIVDDLGSATAHESQFSDPMEWTLLKMPDTPKLTGLVAIAASIREDGATPFVCAVTKERELWVWDIARNVVTQLPWDLDGSKSVVVSEIIGDQNSSWSDCFAVTDKKLFRRKLRLTPTPEWENNWVDWGDCLDFSYTPGEYRYAFKLAPTLLGNVTLYYARAYDKEDNWGWWYAPSLGDFVPQFATGATWLDNGVPRRVGVVVVGTDRRMYYATDEGARSLFSSWKIVPADDVSNITSKPITAGCRIGLPPIIVQPANTPELLVARFWVKEDHIGRFTALDKTSSPRVYAGYGSALSGAEYLIFENSGSRQFNVQELPSSAARNTDAPS
jgi:hypothetical protein